MEEDIKEESIEQITKILEQHLKNSETMFEKFGTLAIEYADIKRISKILIKNKELEEKQESYNTAYNSGKAFEKHRWRSLIKEKIEGLNKKEQELQNSISDEEREEYSDANISFELMDIEIRRSVLQELLEKRK